MDSSLHDPASRLEKAADSLRVNEIAPVEVALILGTGLGQIADRVEDTIVIPYRHIAGFPVPSAPSHAGRLVIGLLSGRRVAVMQGRLHLYEGWSAAELALPIRLMSRLGADRLVVTNAAGGLNPDFHAADVMLIEDHLNMTGHNPLAGAFGKDGPRFPDMSRAYDPEMRNLVCRIAGDCGIALRRGIYAGILGPSLETSAERRFLRLAGADAVGMSTVIEVIAAVDAGMRVLGLSAITNMATGGPEQQPDTIEEVLANAAVTGKKIAELIEQSLPGL